MENFYICRYCRACYSNCEVDCFECEGVGCCYLYQAETYEEALEMSVQEEIVRCIRCACNMGMNTLTDRNRDRTIGECAYVCDTCVDAEEEYCYQQHLKDVKKIEVFLQNTAISTLQQKSLDKRKNAIN